MDDENLKQMKKAAAMPSETASKSNETPSNVNAIPSVIQTKEHYFEALRIWLQQVQLHQAVMQYFPYYLAANYQQSINGAAPFIPSALPIFGATPQGNGSPNGNADQNIPQPAQPAFMNNLFQPNQNNFTDSAQRNLEGSTEPVPLTSTSLTHCPFLGCSHSAERRIRVRHRADLETFRCGNNRHPNPVHHQADGRVYDHRSVRRRPV